MTALFYEQIVEKVVVVSSCRSAELAKLLENTFRHVNVALVNEMAMLCHDMDIDVWEVIDAAATKPFGFMTFTPGPGVGGHCIPLDPSYLAWQVRRDAGRKFRILEEAQDINAQMPGYVSTRIGDALNANGKAVKESRILVLGVTYKPDVADLRESPALRVLATLHRRGATIGFHDPFVDEIEVNGTLVRTHRARTARDGDGRCRRDPDAAQLVRLRVDRGACAAGLRCDQRVRARAPSQPRTAVTSARVRYRRASDALWRVVGDRTYVTRPGRPDFELLMGIGSQAWRILAEPSSAEDLVSRLAFDDPVQDDPGKTVTAMLVDLESRKLLERA